MIRAGLMLIDYFLVFKGREMDYNSSFAVINLLLLMLLV